MNDFRLLEEPEDLRRGHNSGLPGDFLTLAKKSQGGNASDAETLRQACQFFGVHLREKAVTGGLPSDFHKFWCDHFARAAPGRPKVHQHRKRRTAGQSAEGGFRFDLDRFIRRAEFRLAFPAAEVLPEALVNHSVSLAAIRALE
jgi:hypothetical protein